MIRRRDPRKSLLDEWLARQPVGGGFASRNPHSLLSRPEIDPHTELGEACVQDVRNVGRRLSPIGTAAVIVEGFYDWVVIVECLYDHY